MALSRATRNLMRGEDVQIVKRKQAPVRYAEGGSVGDKWMQEAFDKHPKGSLHRQMGVPQDKKIPTPALQKATRSDSTLERKRANLALRGRGL